MLHRHRILAVVLGFTLVLSLLGTAMAQTLPSSAGDTAAGITTTDMTYPIVDTGQEVCYDESNAIACPGEPDNCAARRRVSRQAWLNPLCLAFLG